MMAKTADASMSKFSQKVADEDKTTRGLGKKRKVCILKLSIILRLNSFSVILKKVRV